MRIFVAYRMSETSERSLLDNHVVYRPDIEAKGNAVLGRALSACHPDVLLTTRPLNAAALAAWRAALGGTTALVIRVRHDAGIFEAEIHDSAGTKTCVEPLAADSSIDLQAMRLAEHLYNRHVTCADTTRILRDIGAREQRPGQSVALVGGGVVNLITAYYLQRAGYEVSIFEASADPRIQPAWRTLGCTHGGDDARMFTLSEADNYHDQGELFSDSMNDLFRRDVTASGWRISHTDRFTAAEHAWIEEFERVPPWLARQFNDDIFALNRESKPLWEKLMEDAPELFRDVEHRPGILRLYSDPEHLGRATQRQNRIGATRGILSAAEVKGKYPALSDAVDSGELAGGIEVVGFTVNVHRFLAKLLAHLEGNGAKLHFQTRVDRVERNQDRAALGLIVAGDRVSADHYVMSPGVYGGSLLESSRAARQIHGVLGLWLRVPNLEPKLSHSLKIARRGHIAEDTNVTVAKDQDGREILIFGSGYGYTGSTPDNIRADEIEALYTAVEDTARRFFPRSYEAAAASGMLRESRKLCVRPWTASNLGIFELDRTERGGALILTGGHNTGGFAQAPSVAAAVLAALRGEEHPMHLWYHPDRLLSYYGHKENVR